MADIIICIIVFAAVLLAIKSIVKKRGHSGCCGDCSCCCGHDTENK